MTIVNNTKPTNTIKVKDARAGRPYYWQASTDYQLLVMAFTPCHGQERGCGVKRHFIRLDESDVSGILFDPDEELIPAGRLTCTIDP